MNKSIRDQEFYVELFLRAAGTATFTEDFDFDKYRQSWFRNPLNRQSLRLTQDGFRFAYGIADIDHHTFELQAPLKPKSLLQLERHLMCPYFIRNVRLIKLFGDQDSMMLGLYGGDIQTWLDQLDQNS